MTRMVTSVFANHSGRFFTVRVDVPNRRVTTVAGKLGQAGRTRMRRFASSAEVREFAAQQIDKRVDAGFVQIS